MDTHFFSDSINDLDGGNSYLGLEDEVVVATSGPLPLLYHGGAGTVQNGFSSSMNAPPISSLGQSPVVRLLENSYGDSLCDPALLSGTGNSMSQMKVQEPLTPSSNGTPSLRGTRDSVGTRSSTNSIPSIKESQSKTVARKPSPQAAEQPPRKKARQISTKIKKEEEDEDEEDDKDDTTDKRKKSLEKNRIAASKCREKKKKWVQNLEQQKSHLEQHNLQLRIQHSQLIEELTARKYDLMGHSMCNDPDIDRWLKNQARRVGQTMNPLNSFTATDAPRRDNSNISVNSIASFDPASRRQSFTYSQSSSSILASPMDPSLPMTFESPKIKDDSETNLDFMPDEMLRL